MNYYQNRQEAGRILAHALKSYANRKDVLVLALPRGGVPVAYEVAKALSVPLDVFIVRKLGVPGHEELAFGAIAMGDTIFLNEIIIKSLNISQHQIDQVIAAEKAELQRREKSYRGNRPFPELKNKTIILVDDGIATGATMRVAVSALRKLQPANLIVAIPVAERSTCDAIAVVVDKIICPLQPEIFYAVGAHYITFDQTSDIEVYQLLAKSQSSE